MGIERINKSINNADEFDKRIKSDKILRTLFEVMFDQENRLKVLESAPAVTRVQFKNALKTFWIAL